MKTKIILISTILFSALASLAFQSSPYARRIRPVSSTPASCQENEIAYNMTSHTVLVCTNSGYVALATGGSGGTAAPSDAKYIVQTASASLSAEQALSALATGILKNTTTTGVLSIALAGTDYENPLTFTASDFDRTADTIAIDYTNAQAASGLLKGFLTSADWTTFNNKESALTFDAPLSRSTNTISCATCALTSGDLSQFAATTSAQLFGVISDESGSAGVILRGNLSSLAPNDVLTWNGTDWINSVATGGSLGTGNINMTVANDSGTGTTTGLLAKLTGAPSTVRNTQTTDTENAVGVCTSGCGTTGNATIAIAGQVDCQFDGSTTAGNYVVISATAAGKCHDNGSTFPTDKAAYGRVLTTNVGAGTYSMTLMTPDIAFQNAGNGKSRPGGSNTQVQYNANNQFGGITNATSDGTTLTLTSPKIVTGLLDTNGNPFLAVSATASAVNGITITNGIAGSPGTVDIAATGSDTNINLTLSPKGTGQTFSTKVIGITSGGTPKVQMQNSGLANASSSGVFWASTTSSAGSIDVGLSRNAAGVLEVNSGSASVFRDLKVRMHFVDQTITAGGTTGNQTINKSAGTVNFAAAATAITVTNSLATANSTIHAMARTNDATCSVKNVVPAAGSFVINMTAGCTAETSVGFLVVN